MKIRVARGARSEQTVATYRDIREMLNGTEDDMKIRDATDKANEALSGAAAKVERAGLTKWILVALGVLLLILIGVWASAAHATGGHYVPVVVPQVSAAAPVTAPVVPPAAPPAVTPPPSTGTPPPAQPSGGSGPGTVSWIAFGAVVVYFANVIRVHWIACAQREEKWHKDNKVARCYNAERDGLPEARR